MAKHRYHRVYAIHLKCDHRNINNISISGIYLGGHGTWNYNLLHNFFFTVKTVTD